MASAGLRADPEPDAGDAAIADANDVAAPVTRQVDLDRVADDAGHAGMHDVAGLAAAAPEPQDGAGPARRAARTGAGAELRRPAARELAGGGHSNLAGERAWTTRERIARRAQASTRAVSAAAPVAAALVAPEAGAGLDAQVAHARRPGEAAATHVEPEVGADLGLELQEVLAPAAMQGSARQRAGARRANAGERGCGGGALSRPVSWPRPSRALIRSAGTGRRDADAPAQVRPVEAHARGPPSLGGTDPTARHAAVDETAAAEWVPPGLRRVPWILTLAGAPVIQAKLAVSVPGDRFELEADAVAARVVRGAIPRPPNTGTVAGSLPRSAPRQRGPPPTGFPASVGQALQTGGGRPLHAALRERIEPHVGIDLAHVRVRHEPAAARDIQAQAFTSGATIFLAAGSSATDVALMAHEAAHVAQQGSSAPARATLQRLEAADLIPDWILDGVRSAIRAIPGYSILTTIVGKDLLTGEPATTSREELVEKLLTYGPFGAAVGPLLSTINVLGDVFAVISEGLAANNLTLARIGRDVDTALSEFSITNGISGNLAIVERLVRALLRDVANFVSSIVDRVIELVRAVAVSVAEPLLETPQIKPIWDLAKKVLHYDPLRGEPVKAETADIIADFLTLIGQEERLAQMRERGTLQETADWLDTQLAIFSGLIDELGTLFSDAWQAIQPENLPDLLTNLGALAQRALRFVQRVGEFGATLVLKILELVKHSLLGWLSETAHGIPGFRLLTVILEQNPFTGERVERTAVNLIRGFITLMPSGEETYDKLAESGVIDQAAERIESEMARLGISVDLITGIFLGIWDTLTLDDLLDPIGAFGRVLALFGEPLSRLVEFVVVVVEVIVTLVLRLMNFPSDLLGSIIANAVQAIGDIRRDPVGFLLHMLEAVKVGFSSFLGHIGGYLVNGLASWLFRGLAAIGIQAPPDYSLGSILNLVFEVLGLTIEHLWEKLGEHIGAERVATIRGAIDKLTGAWAFIQEVQRDGLAAIGRFIADQLSGLWDTLLGMAKDWVMTSVVSAVATKLLSLLDPTGIMAVVNSFIAFFNAVQSAIDYLREILEIINQYVSTLAAVAAGNIAPGAQMLEQGLANAIPVAIGFLANQVGLGNIPEKIVELIGRLRELVDKALDWLIEKALALGKAALDALGLGRTKDAPSPAAAGAGGPKQQAEALLKARLADAKTPAELGPIVAQIRTQLQPAGLSGLDMRGPSADGTYEIFAAASEFTQLCALVPALGGPRAVTLNVRLLMHTPDVALEGEPSVASARVPARDPSGAILTDAAGRPVMVTTHIGLPPVIAHGRSSTARSTSGGVALAPVPGSGTIRLLTYNTSEDPRSDNNLSHAERQLQEFFERAPATAGDVKEIHADINLSPCSICTSSLAHITRLTRRATKRILHWQKLYRHPRRGTTNASLGAIGGWTVIPSAISGGPTPQEQAELQAANWATLT
ncbi:MAG: hypothetical protein QOJ63_3030 [Solirubrobacteraceae bacterium]|nr:hypothetical protein [Solirubrobacteraceae bacterium]